MDKVKYTFFLDVEQKAQGPFGLDPFKGAGTAKIHPDSWEPLAPGSQAAREDFHTLRNIFNNGVQVSKDGCIYPHPAFSTRTEENKRTADERVMLALMGVQTVGGHYKADEQTGWPNWAEISHYYCHHSHCCNPLHLQIQAAWQHRRRTYCGFSGQCDCGSQPPCHLPYRPFSPMQPEDLCSSTEEVKHVLADTFSSCGLRLKTLREVAMLDTPAAKRATKEHKLKRAKQRKAAKCKRQQQAKTAAEQNTRKEAKPLSKDDRKLLNAAKRAQAGEKQAYQAAKNAGKRVAQRLTKSRMLSKKVQAAVEAAAEAAYLKHSNG